MPQTDHPCAHCGGTIWGPEETCSDICAEVVAGKWPSPVGPADHDEMVGWIAAEKTRIKDEKAKQVAAQLAEAAEKKRRGEPITVGLAEDLSEAIREFLGAVD